MKTSAIVASKRLPKVLSGFSLKMIAIVTMFIDHFAAVVLTPLLLQGSAETPATAFDSGFGAYMSDPATRWLMILIIVMRSIGRLAFPIFCFLLVEGYFHTCSRFYYALRLGFLALFSEVPFDLALSAETFNLTYQNVFVTLFFGLLAIWATDETVRHLSLFQQKPWLSGLSWLAAVPFAALALLMKTDYGAFGVLFIALLFVSHRYPMRQLLIGALSVSWEVTAPLAFVPIALYNGKRGIPIKWVFYFFYPVHLLLLVGIRYYLMG